MSEINLISYNFSFSRKNKMLRGVWNIAYLLFFTITPSTFKIFKYWRNFILRIFGAKIGCNTLIYSNVLIWAPWNLEVGDNCCIGSKVDCYNQGKIRIGNNTTISQKTYLCASTHDYNKPDFPLLLKPITIGNGVWIAAGAFIGPNVNIGHNVIVAARAVVVKNVDNNTVVGGNPATKIKDRT
ncbi:putative colanic acid biosynthesis acetyltransferase WcaF [Flavobacterium micromati]|uniref:Putative colanic acid biosynthesis acetyltransferase WcaF n=1 Tax=Flavobacterium micromati TaxID=229205 RepID=A0A1M5JKU0_9FLAO|nr:putative colanic acid biosynthesis acetyltransferase [Flavobacterium micromati]SHG41194.1 putative colanic acid biosynthesis acetyltransferase WcaF [Flavobacterium micromati]